MAKYYGYCYNGDGKFTGEIIPLEYTINEETHEETPLVPPQCTLDLPPDGIYYPVFLDGKWIKTVESPPELDLKPQEKTEIELIKEELDRVRKELEELKNKPIAPEEEI